MKLFNRKSKMLALLLSTGVMFSANAEQPSLESALAKVVIEQSQLVMKELSAQLQESIAKGVKIYSIDNVLVGYTPTSNKMVKSTENQKQNLTADE
ncbi:MAG: hypothetical protein HRT38_10240 [Alteromonadaceae bacterium]|nr:hypothetical protein [Alteromonadaceae bacterium]